MATLWIVIAAVFDFGDGFAARSLHAYSPMGKELDSLSDMVSFGVAPGMIVYWLLEQACMTAPVLGEAAGYRLCVPFCRTSGQHRVYCRNDSCGDPVFVFAGI